MTDVQHTESKFTESAIWTSRSGVHGDRVLLIHGSMDRSAGLLKLSRRLADRYDVIRYDRRGYGRSTEVGPPYDIAGQVADAVDVLEAWPPGSPAVVFGHSLGGNVALALAERRPDLVRAVIVYETPLSWLDWWPGGTVGAEALGVDDPADAAEMFMRRMIGDERWEHLPRSTRMARRAEGVAMVAELHDIRTRPPWSCPPVPVLAMSGERGREHHRHSTSYLASTLPDCRPVHVPGASHGGPHSHPDVVAVLVTDFLDALAGRATTQHE